MWNTFFLEMSISITFLERGAVQDGFLSLQQNTLSLIENKKHKTKRT